MTVHVGTSGWMYRDWKGVLYPPKLPSRAWLPWYASTFDVVEVNATFYRLPQAGVFASWHDRTPPGFRFVVKASRYLTHIRRLRDPEEPVALLRERMAALLPKVAAVLVQLPPDLMCEPERLDRTLTAFDGLRVAFEPRHRSWDTAEVDDVLAAHDAVRAATDRRNVRHVPSRAAPWGYVRLHEGTAAPRPCYGDRALAWWAATVAAHHGASDDVYVFFNNDARACAVRNAVTFQHLLGVPAHLPAFEVPA